jgi:1,4-dihydroxy-6-naphthoate synthase
MTMRLRLGHSPDPDDAFMWWPLFAEPVAEGGACGPFIDTGRFLFEPVRADIEALNRRAEGGDLEITALSCAQYPRVADRYAITACGASLGDRFGPRIVARTSIDVTDLRDPSMCTAVPGERTSAFGAMSLLLGPGTFRYEVVPFETILERVAAGDFDAGLVIHEGQLTFGAAGLHLACDLGAWWWERHALPLPLGLNAARRDLEQQGGPGTLAEVAAILRRSVEHALADRERGVAAALRFARGLSRREADRFVGMYVNHWTLDFGATGRAAVRAFLDELAAAGVAPATPSVDFVTG